MYNWNTDTTRLQNNPTQQAIFELEQKINFGLNNTKISLAKLKENWDDIEIDQAKRNYLKKIVWNQS